MNLNIFGRVRVRVCVLLLNCAHTGYHMATYKILVLGCFCVCSIYSSDKLQRLRKICVFLKYQAMIMTESSNCKAFGNTLTNSYWLTL